MEYPLVQYGCNNCGNLTEVMDVDQPLPKGWVILSSHTHYCPECAKKLNIKGD